MYREFIHIGKGKRNMVRTLKKSVNIILWFLVLLLGNCSTNQTSLEERMQFYYAYCDSLFPQSLPAQECIETFIENSPDVTQFIYSMVDTPVTDQFQRQRAAYLQKNNVPSFILKTVANREFIIGMTLQEFWLSLGDSTVFCTIRHRTTRGDLYIDLTKDRPGLPFGNVITFKNGVLYELGII